MLDILLLSRIQFAANISFHILFPSISIALCWILLYFKLRYDFSQNPLWMRAYRFWVKIFALTFALGVVSGITMSFQFGTNWPGFMETVGNIAGPLLGYEVLTAFFLEATFLGIMLFGINKVSPRIHTLSTFLVAIGTTLSAFWILVLNSWMQTPAGFEIRNEVIYPSNWWAIIFNPSFPYRFTHVLLASALTAGFMMTGISAYRLLKGDSKKAPRATLKTGIIMLCFLAPLQAFIGDLHGLNTLKHQPQKVAAMEGIWETSTHVPLLLFAIPDEKTKTNHFEVAIPNLASLILTHRADGQLQGLNDFAENIPPVKAVFFSFRVMVGMGVFMILLAWLGGYFICRKKSLPKPLLITFVTMTFSGWLATLAGWYVTEMGRQPYLVNGILTTADAVTNVAPAHVALSLSLYLTVYALLLWAYIRTIFSMARKAIDVEEFEINTATPSPALEGKQHA